MAAYEPRWVGVKELNLADLWRAKWVDEQELPENAPVHYVYALLLLGDKGYAVREAGANRWGMIEGLVGERSVDEFLEQELKARAGATIGQAEMVGFLECKATRLNPDFPAGHLTVRPLYVVAAKTVADTPPNSGYERRRFPQNEYAVAMRARYPEIIDYLSQAFGRYAVMQAQVAKAR